MSNNGKIGEQKFKQIMIDKGYVVDDLTDNSYYWDKDIDFMVKSQTGKIKSFEVKWDYRINKTGNLYLEIANAHSKGMLGWYQFCQADYLAYGDAINGTFYIIPLLELKKRVDKMKYKRQANCGFDSVGWLIPLKDIKDIVQTL